jgi:lipoyl(octanoyl) transferase
MISLTFNDLGLIHYKKAWDYQIQLFENIISKKNASQRIDEHHMLFCEHPHVFTIGKNGDQANLLINNELLKEKEIEFYHIDRGGDITYHGPGQQVVYPILDLDEFGINTREYVYRLEEAVIQTLKEFSIKASRLGGAAGIWLDVEDKTKCRKICAIGVKSSRRVTMHGLALNINTDLNYFSYMNPCGFVDKGVTSMQKELGEIIDIEIVKIKLKANILKSFEI